MPKSESIDRDTRDRLRRHLLAVMAEQRMNKNQIAKALGVSRSTVGAIINGDRTMGLDVFIKLHRQYVPASYMLDRDPTSSPPPAGRGFDAVSRTDPGIQKAARRHGSGR
jgi:DNA-binding XRE family transcriptional regulator